MTPTTAVTPDPRPTSVPRAIAHILDDVEILRVDHAVFDGDAISSRWRGEAEYKARREAARLLSEVFLDKAIVTTVSHDNLKAETRFRIEAPCLSVKDVAVLLSRAYEVGRSGRR